MTGLKRWALLDRGQCCLGGGHWEFVAAEVFGVGFGFFRVGGLHFGHGFVGLAVVVGGVPEQEADAAFFFGGFYLNLDVFGRVGFGAPVEGLQPGADNYAAGEVSVGMGDLFEAGHGFADEVGGLVAGVGDVVHAEEVAGIDHGAEDVAVVGHADDVLSGVGEVDGALPGHDSEDVEAEEHAGRVEFGVGFFQEGGDDVGALRAVPLGGGGAGGGGFWC